VRARLTDTGARVRHTITHRRITVEVWRGVLLTPLVRRSGWRWAGPGRRDLALTALARNLIEG
jgi:hypothetical protein